MSITLSPELETRLAEVARREGQSVQDLVSGMIRDFLDSFERPERVRPWAEFIAELRSKYNLPEPSPGDVTVTETAPGEFVCAGK
jgi:hypothetical protein